MDNNLGDKVVADITKDFVAVGKSHVHAWYAWAIVGIVFGMALGIVYVSNRSAQFNASKAAMLLDNGTNQGGQPPLGLPNAPVGQNDTGKFAIVWPHSMDVIETNPSVTVRFDFPEEQIINANLSFSYAPATPGGIPTGSFTEVAHPSQYRSVYTSNEATYVLPNFEYLEEGNYVIRATLTLRNNSGTANISNNLFGGGGSMPFYSDVLIHEVGSKLQTVGDCSCKEIKLEDRGAQGYGGMQHGFKIIANLKDGSTSGSCGEHQYVKATGTFTDGEKTTTVYSTSLGIDGWKTQDEIDSANQQGANITAMPYEGTGYADDNFMSQSQTSQIGAKKFHYKDRIEWFDAPGIISLPTGATGATFDAELWHVVNPGCDCKTQIHVKVVDGEVTENTLTSDCDK